MHVRDAFASFPGLWLRHTSGLAGEYAIVQSFEDISTCSDLFVGPRDSAHVCTCLQCVRVAIKSILQV